MNEQTRKIEILRSELNRLQRDMKGISPSISSYKVRAEKARAIRAEILELKKIRGATISQDVRGALDVIRATDNLPAQSIVP